MTQKELKKAILEYLESREMGRFLPVYFHQKKRIGIVVEYPESRGGSKTTSLVDYVYLDHVKKRLFFVGKSRDLKTSFLGFKKRNLLLKLETVWKWAKSSDRQDGYGVYFAWNYEHRDDVLFDYVPLSGEVGAEESPESLWWIALKSEEGKTFRTKARNLHEKRKRV